MFGNQNKAFDQINSIKPLLSTISTIKILWKRQKIQKNQSNLVEGRIANQCCDLVVLWQLTILK